MDLHAAIGSHAEWKLKLRVAILNHESMDAETMSKDNWCELGEWLHGEAKTRFGSLPSYTECVARHAAFHVEAGKVARTINAERYAEAESMLAFGTSYESASTALGVAVLNLRSEAGF